LRFGGGGVTIGSKLTTVGDGLTPSDGINVAIDGNAAAIIFSIVNRRLPLTTHFPVLAPSSVKIARREKTLLARCMQNRVHTPLPMAAPMGPGLTRFAVICRGCFPARTCIAG
jgi:hypothetical protein